MMVGIVNENEMTQKNKLGENRMENPFYLVEAEE